MATVETEELPFRRLSHQAEELAEEIESKLKQLRIVLRDVDAAERNEAYQAARQRGEDRFGAATAVVDRARYVLNVVEAQHIGNTSEAWHTGVRRLREALDELESLS
jgi:hypothetical protein